MKSPLIDVRDFHGGNWQVFEVTPTMRRSRMWIDEKQYIVKTEYLASDSLLEMNKAQRDENEGKRWGDGKVAARVPLNVFYRDIAPYLKTGDDDHVKWWMNHEDNAQFRTKKGTI